ncbi:hypothetical protein [Massilia sp. DD77]|uniref:hypothetical protein n=1 Tax=Massilia sp. DD77 TaxID=3109349 RepID=UPI0030004888
MITWLRRHAGPITFVLSLSVIVLALSNAWKHELVSSRWLAGQKDALAALNSIVTMLILVAGSIFSYYRFFKGRTLSLRVELSLEASVHQTPEQYRIHAISLSAKNVGSSTVWNPTPQITVQIHGPDGAAETRHITQWSEEAGSEANMAAVIDAGEAAFFFAHQHIPDSAWAVTYFASMKADQGDEWHISKTISNKEPKSG